jgi:hypothetical protein
VGFRVSCIFSSELIVGAFVGGLGIKNVLNLWGMLANWEQLGTVKTGGLRGFNLTEKNDEKIFLVLAVEIGV